VSEGDSVVLPFPSPCAPVKHARSTLVLGSLDSLRRAGHFERYSALLEPAYRETLLDAVAGVWLPVAAALAHYRACDALGLTAEAEVDMGRRTYEGTEAVIFGTIIRLAKSSGVTPWTVMAQYQRLWDRGYDGGGIRIIRLGPKEARIELAHCPLADHRYYRHALRGTNHGVLGAFATKLYIKDVSGTRAPGTMALRAQWV
jgi:hypothetical protein